MRINLESVFERFDVELSDAFCKALVETTPLMTTKDALRTYRAFRRNAIIALAAWEDLPSVAVAPERTATGPGKPKGDGIALPSVAPPQE